MTHCKVFSRPMIEKRPKSSAVYVDFRPCPRSIHAIVIAGNQARMYSVEDHSYHSHYSEENIYKLAYKYANQSFEYDKECDSFVVFISNDSKHVPMWKQRLSSSDEEPVLWDYHVIYVIPNETGEADVIDLDSTLGYRVPFAKYMKETFHPDSPLANKDHNQLFRVLPADLYLDYFASDRSHMVTSYPNYKQKPPSWAPIKGPKAETEMNLENYISMEPQESENYGKVMTLQDFMEMGMGTQ